MQIFLLVLSLTYCVGQSLSQNVADCLCLTDNTTITTYTLDEETMKDLKTEIKLLSSSNKILEVRLDMLTLRLEQQAESFNKIHESLNAQTECRNANDIPPPIDVRSDFGHEQQLVNCTLLKKHPSDCAEAASSKRFGGIYTIQLDKFYDKPFLVVCDETTQGGGWTVIQSRKDGSIDFFRNWKDYKVGFGNLETEFFIGLDKLHALTTENGPQELLIMMTDFDGVTKFAKYSSFAIGNEEEGYALKVLGAYSGDAGDSFTPHVGYKFTTKDVDNDSNAGNCANMFKGAWWYYSCHKSNLNGLYLKGDFPKDKYAQGVVWFDWRGHYYSLKEVKMMIRPRRI